MKLLGWAHWTRCKTCRQRILYIMKTEDDIPICGTCLQIQMALAIVAMCPRPRRTRCNDVDPDMCCGGGREAGCDCDFCHQEERSC